MSEHIVKINLRLEYLYTLKVEAESEAEAQELATASDLGIVKSLAGFYGPSILESKEIEIIDNG